MTLGKNKRRYQTNECDEKKNRSTGKGTIAKVSLIYERNNCRPSNGPCKAYLYRLLLVIMQNRYIEAPNINIYNGRI